MRRKHKGHMQMKQISALITTAMRLAVRAFSWQSLKQNRSRVLLLQKFKINLN